MRASVLALVLTFLAGAAVQPLIRSATAASAAATVTVVRWEYRCEPMQGSNEQRQTLLNEAGADGWDVAFAMEPVPGNALPSVCFKRAASVSVAP